MAVTYPMIINDDSDSDIPNDNENDHDYSEVYNDTVIGI